MKRRECAGDAEDVESAVNPGTPEAEEADLYEFRRPCLKKTKKKKTVESERA